MEEIGIVQKITDETVEITLVNKTADGCEGCSMGAICMVKTSDCRGITLDIKYASGLKKGDRVKVIASGYHTVLFYFLIFILPLIMLIALIYVTGLYFSQPASLGISIIPVILYYLFIKFFEKTFLRKIHIEKA